MDGDVSLQTLSRNILGRNRKAGQPGLRCPPPRCYQIPSIASSSILHSPQLPLLPASLRRSLALGPASSEPHLTFL